MHSHIAGARGITAPGISLQRLRSTGLSVDGAVPGLRGALAAADLAALAARAEVWCDEAGAVLLEEVLEDLEDLCEALGLNTAQQGKFHAALQLRACGPGKSVAPSALHRSCTEAPFTLTGQ